MSNHQSSDLLTFQSYICSLGRSFPNLIDFSIVGDPDPVPNFHVDADPDGHQNNPDPHADPTPEFYTYWKILIFLLSVTTLPFYNVSSFSSVSNVRPRLYLHE